MKGAQIYINMMVKCLQPKLVTCIQASGTQLRNAHILGTGLATISHLSPIQAFRPPPKNSHHVPMQHPPTLIMYVLQYFS